MKSLISDCSLRGNDFYQFLLTLSGFSGGSEVKASACNAGDLGSVPGSRRSPGEGNGNPLQYPCLENHMDGGAWWATVHGVTKSRTQLSDFAFTFHIFLTLSRDIYQDICVCSLSAYILYARIYVDRHMCTYICVCFFFTQMDAHCSVP